MNEKSEPVPVGEVLKQFKVELTAVNEGVVQSYLVAMKDLKFEIGKITFPEVEFPAIKAPMTIDGYKIKGMFLDEFSDFQKEPPLPLEEM